MRGINPLLLKDGYKVGHKFQYPADTEFIYSNLTPRKSRRTTKTSGVIFFGLQFFLTRTSSTVRKLRSLAATSGASTTTSGRTRSPSTTSPTCTTSAICRSRSRPSTSVRVTQCQSESGALDR